MNRNGLTAKEIRDRGAKRAQERREREKKENESILKSDWQQKYHDRIRREAAERKDAILAHKETIKIRKVQSPVEKTTPVQPIPTIKATFKRATIKHRGHKSTVESAIVQPSTVQPSTGRRFRRKGKHVSASIVQKQESVHMAKNQEFTMIEKNGKLIKEFHYCQAPDGCDKETVSYSSIKSKGSKKYCAEHGKVATKVWKNMIGDQAAARETLRVATLDIVKPYLDENGIAYKTISGRSTLANDAVKSGAGVKMGKHVIIRMDLGKNPWQALSQINAELSLLGVKDGLIM